VYRDTQPATNSIVTAMAAQHNDLALLPQPLDVLSAIGSFTPYDGLAPKVLAAD
jgi:hypothetical protein